MFSTHYFIHSSWFDEFIWYQEFLGGWKKSSELKFPWWKEDSVTCFAGEIMEYNINLNISPFQPEIIPSCCLISLPSRWWVSWQRMVHLNFNNMSFFFSTLHIRLIILNCCLQLNDLGLWLWKDSFISGLNSLWMMKPMLWKQIHTVC